MENVSRHTCIKQNKQRNAYLHLHINNIQRSGVLFLLLKRLYFRHIVVDYKNTRPHQKCILNKSTISITRRG